jgi:hypothetical protein
MYTTYAATKKIQPTNTISMVNVMKKTYPIISSLLSSTTSASTATAIYSSSLYYNNYGATVKSNGGIASKGGGGGGYVKSTYKSKWSGTTRSKTKKTAF